MKRPKKNAASSYRGVKTYTTAGVIRVFTPTPKWFSGLGAKEAAQSHIDAYLKESPLSNPRRTPSIGAKTDYPKIVVLIDGKYGITSWFPTVKAAKAHFQAKHPGAEIVAYFQAPLKRKKNTSKPVGLFATGKPAQLTLLTNGKAAKKSSVRRNTHLAVGTLVLTGRNKTAHIVSALPKDRYVIRYSSTGSKQTVSGATLTRG